MSSKDGEIIDEDKDRSYNSLQHKAVGGGVRFLPHH